MSTLNVTKIVETRDPRRRQELLERTEEHTARPEPHTRIRVEFKQAYKVWTHEETIEYSYDGADDRDHEDAHERLSELIIGVRETAEAECAMRNRAAAEEVAK
jgi:hypothetical protein